jgi:hypothetical protein
MEASQASAREPTFWTSGRLAFAFLAGLLVLFVSFAGMQVMGLVSCGGDGGSPYAAPASPRGKFCDAAESVPLWGPMTAFLLGLWAAGRARRIVYVIVGVVVAVGLAVGPPLVAGLLSKECAAGESGLECLHY